jgi:KaiC/GvpD/RAD55 family RecA-like ATPase
VGHRYAADRGGGMSVISSPPSSNSPDRIPADIETDPCPAIPSELRKFLSRPGPQSLLIRGPPGCGKTTLALSLLDGFSGTRVLVTNRVTKAEIQADFPWLDRGGPDRVRIVDGAFASQGVARAAEAVGAVTGFLGATGNDDLTRFLWLPVSLQEAYASLDPLRPAMVVIDSWDSLVEEFVAKAATERVGLPDRQDVERLLLAYMRRSAVTLVIVLERDVQSQLDYLVSGVVVAHKQSVEGRLERTLSLAKLRGVRIRTAGYPYTLEGAHFRSIDPFRHETIRFNRRRTPALRGEPSPQLLPGQIWPGNRDFAEEFGVFEGGTTTVVECDPAIAFPVSALLVEAPVALTLAAGGRVLIIPPPGTQPGDVYQPYRAIFPAEKLAALLRIFSVAGTEGVTGEVQACVLALHRGSDEAPTDPIFHHAFEFIRTVETEGVSNLIVRTTSGQRALAQLLSLPVTPENFAQVTAAYVANLAAHQIVIGNIGDRLLEALNDLGSLRLQLRAREGRYFLNGIRPFTSSFALAECDDISPYDLIRMV